MQSPFVDDWGRLSPPLNTVGRKNQNLDGATTRNLALELYSTTASTSLIFSCGFAVSFYLVACMFLSPSPANSTFDYPTAPFSSQSLFDILWTHLNFCLFPLLLAVFVVAVRVFMGFTAIKKFLVIVKDLNLAGSSSGGLTNIERKQVYLPILQKSVKRLVAASVLGIAFMVSLCFASPRFRELNASMLAATVAAETDNDNNDNNDNNYNDKSYLPTYPPLLQTINWTPIFAPFIVIMFLTLLRTLLLKDSVHRMHISTKSIIREKNIQLSKASKVRKKKSVIFSLFKIFNPSPNNQQQIHFILSNKILHAFLNFATILRLNHALNSATNSVSATIFLPSVFSLVLFLLWVVFILYGGFVGYFTLSLGQITTGLIYLFGGFLFVLGFFIITWEEGGIGIAIFSMSISAFGLGLCRINFWEIEFDKVENSAFGEHQGLFFEEAAGWTISDQTGFLETGHWLGKIPYASKGRDGEQDFGGFC